MRLTRVGIIAFTLSSGCLRFGYDQQAAPAVREPDAATAADASAPEDASVMDAAMRDAAPPAPAADAGERPQDSAMDAAVGGSPADAAATMDAARANDAGKEDPPLSDAGSSDPCVGRTDLLFCGGFDNAAVWGPTVASNGTAVTTTERARSGSSSLYASTGAANSGSSSARRDAEVFNAQTSGDVWSRAFFYLPAGTMLDASTLLATMRLTEAQQPYAGCSLVIRPDSVQLGGISTRFRTLSAFPRDVWTCVELHVAISNDQGLCEAYVDGMQSAISQEGDTLPAGGYTLLSVGLDYTNAAQGPVDLYIDDVAAGNTRVGCD